MSGGRPLPYSPSWVDRLTDRIDALPGPAWVPYAVVGVTVFIVAHVTAWAEGLVTASTLDPYVTSIAIYIVTSFAAIHYLDWAAGRAWAAFRPAVQLDDAEATRVAYELTTMPARPTLLWATLGAVFAIGYTADVYGKPIDLEGEPITFVLSLVLSLISFAAAAAFIYHTIRQLRLISRVHGYVDRVDLLHLDPLHAFAGVTATTAIILLGIVYLSVLTDPATFTSPTLFAFTIATIPLATACFVVPLYGIHQRIVAEKSARLAAVNGRLDAALRDLDRRADERDLSEADAFNKHLSSLLAQRDVIARAPTWPWAPETLRGFATALVLPIVLWLTFRLLEGQIG